MSPRSSIPQRDWNNNRFSHLLPLRMCAHHVIRQYGCQRLRLLVHLQYASSLSTLQTTKRSGATAAPPPPTATATAAAGDSHEKDRLQLVSLIMERDREVLELKRIHELSMRRVEQSQRRRNLDTEEKAVYFEQAVSRLNLDATTVTDHTFRNVEHHRDMAKKMKYNLMLANLRRVPSYGLS